MTVSEIVSRAMDDHRAGRLAQAEAGYRAALTLDPTHFDALHLLGFIHHQRGDHRAAIEWMHRALDQEPGAFPAHTNLGLAYAALDEFEAARASFENAVELNPEYAPAHGPPVGPSAEYPNLSNPPFHVTIQGFPKFNQLERAMARVCQVTGKHPMVGNNVSHANNKTKRRFLPNLQRRRFWVESENRWVNLRLTNAALRTIDKKGIDVVVAELRARGEHV